MSKQTKQALIFFVAGVIITFLALYPSLNPAEKYEKVSIPSLEFSVPYKVHDLVSENFIIRITDKASDPELKPGTKMVIVPESPGTMTEEQFNQVAEGNMDVSSEKGIITVKDITAKYFRTNEYTNSYIAIVRDDRTDRTWQFTFDNLKNAEVLSIITSIRILDN
ncbi:MAG: hypothetical protein IKE12_03535 [Erysipelotrichaceae bacterium]|nr:hypothetical protein [Erysipelotrichaceae bacterium]MBR2791721.1 hypothetical protein [Erysipelotrichaceae bacterium]